MSSGLLDTAKITGLGAASAKYDVLTALLALATQGESVEARLALRLSLLITARYNWRRGSFAVGQKELARMWGVTERTVKREMAELRGRGWIVVDVPAARGRVASYKIDFEKVLMPTTKLWGAVGSDFKERMEQKQQPDIGQVSSNVVPFQSMGNSNAEDVPEFWMKICEDLRSQDQQTYQSWFAHLVFVGRDNEAAKLEAPNKFLADYINTHLKARLFATMLRYDNSIKVLRIEVRG